MRIIRRNKDVMAISEAELAALTADMEERHRESLPRMRESVTEWVETHGPEAREGAVSRRGFLAGGGLLVVGGAVLAACGSSGPTAATSTTTAAGSSGANLDVQVGAMAASLENLAVFAYNAGIQAAQAGKLGTVPPAVVTFATTAKAQHQDHADAWNAIVTGAGYQKVTVTDPAVTPTVQSGFAQVKDVGGLAKLALELENIASATYLNGIGVVQSHQAVSTAATIQPVEMQHAAILNFVLGQYPVPDAFAKTDGARPPTDYSVKKA
ncbi:MAG TPA: ferritin-like domain-containing protein [Acidimicrobiales bacterium]|nr:ferritin-like domain-containing protein [Acidimicrobiales bacterium]